MARSRRTRRVARQLFRLCVVAGKLDPDRVRQVGSRLGKASERGSLAVLSEFQRRVRLDRARHTATVESAVPLADDVRRDVEAQLAKRHGDDVEVSFTLNPALIAGMRIKVGSDVYDGSVRARLNEIAERL